MMKPPKTIIEKAKANGALDRASLLLSAAYLLCTEASVLVDEASDTLRRNGLLLGEMKKLHGDFIRSADRYFRCFSEMIAESGRVNDYFADLESFDRFFRKWAKLKNAPDPAQEMNMNKKTEQKV